MVGRFGVSHWVSFQCLVADDSLEFVLPLITESTNLADVGKRDGFILQSLTKLSHSAVSVHSMMSLMMMLSSGGFKI